jgi:hypothetical protein
MSVPRKIAKWEFAIIKILHANVRLSGMASIVTNISAHVRMVVNVEQGNVFVLRDSKVTTVRELLIQIVIQNYAILEFVQQLITIVNAFSVGMARYVTDTAALARMVEHVAQIDVCVLKALVECFAKKL